MSQVRILGATLASALLLTGCGITALDNYDPPTSEITGRVLYNGEPVGVRSGGVQLELWQPSYELNQKIPVRIAQDGTFSAAVFNGSYEINLLPGNGPWVDDPTRIPVEVNGSTSLDIDVIPYYTIQDEAVSFDPNGGGPHGTVSATFRVGKVDTSLDLEYVGLYVGVTTLVDRNNSLTISNSQRERARSAIQTELDENGLITITIELPENIYETQSPWQREYVFARVGVKTQGVAEMLFSPVYKVEI